MVQNGRREIIAVQNEDKKNGHEISGGLLGYWFLALLGPFIREKIRRVLCKTRFT